MIVVFGSKPSATTTVERDDGRLMKINVFTPNERKSVSQRVHERLTRQK